jgi:hypothetical protein
MAGELAPKLLLFLPRIDSFPYTVTGVRTNFKSRMNTKRMSVSSTKLTNRTYLDPADSFGMFIAQR